MPIGMSLGFKSKEANPLGLEVFLLVSIQMIHMEFEAA